MDPNEYYENLCKSFYESSISRKDNIMRLMALPAGATIVFGGIIAFFVQTRYLFQCDLWSGLLTVFTLLMGAGVLWSASQLVWALFAGKYAYLPLAESIDEYLAALLEYHNTDALDTGEGEEALRKFKELLIRQYIFCSTHNTLKNMNKSARVFRSYWGIWISLIFLFFAIFPFTVILYSQ